MEVYHHRLNKLSFHNDSLVKNDSKYEFHMIKTTAHKSPKAIKSLIINTIKALRHLYGYKKGEVKERSHLNPIIFIPKSLN